LVGAVSNIPTLEVGVNSLPLKLCKRCGQERPGTPEFFRRASRNPDGLSYYCKACLKRMNRERYWRDVEATRGRFAAYREANRERTREHGLSYVRRHRERVRARDRRYRLENREKERARHADYHRRHRERIIAARRERRRAGNHVPDRRYYRANRARYRTYKLIRRARVNGAQGHFTAREFRAKCAYFGWRCFYCHKPTPHLELDHYIPLARGGTNFIGNIVPACRGCNRRKSTRTGEEFLASLGRSFLD
jgi:hypothetical protein